MKSVAIFTILGLMICFNGICQNIAGVLNERESRPRINRSRVAVRVLDKHTLKPVASTIIVVGQMPGKQIVPTYEEGVYKFNITPGDTSVMSIYADGYETLTETILANKMSPRENFYLTPKSRTSPIKTSGSLNNDASSSLNLGEEKSSVLYFEQSSASIPVASRPQLDQILRYLARNPSMEIRLSGHTDDVGEQAKNQVLSEERVERVKKYLLDNNIPATKISGRGFGSDVPAAPNDSEENRRLNRRVEIRVSE